MTRGGQWSLSGIVQLGRSPGLVGLLTRDGGT